MFQYSRQHNFFGESKELWTRFSQELFYPRNEEKKEELPPGDHRSGFNN